MLAAIDHMSVVPLRTAIRRQMSSQDLSPTTQSQGAASQHSKLSRRAVAPERNWNAVYTAKEVVTIAVRDKLDLAFWC